MLNQWHSVVLNWYGDSVGAETPVHSSPLCWRSPAVVVVAVAFPEQGVQVPGAAIQLHAVFTVLPERQAHGGDIAVRVQVFASMGAIPDLP